MSDDELDALLEQLWIILTKIHDALGEDEMMKHINDAIIIARMSNPDAAISDHEKKIMERVLIKLKQ